jgi:cytochrome c biogenesis protein CcmG/thiol:disulfide interchange protein DsbE
MRFGVLRGLWIPLILTAAVSRGASHAELKLKSIDGHAVRLSQYRGKIVVLNFWATWCAPCNIEMPVLVEAEKDYGPRGVIFVAISLDEAKTLKQVPAFVNRYHVGFPVWLGASGDDLDRLGMGHAVPATAFRDREGSIVFRVRGPISQTELKDRLEWLLGSTTGPKPLALVRHLDR